jgi:phosphate transport system substrate-binding protein
MVSMISCASYNPKKSEQTNTSSLDSLTIGIAVTTIHLVKLAESEFNGQYPHIKTASYIHETGNVVDDVIMGKTQIAITTRNLKDYEKEKSATIMATPIGKDGLVLAISKDIPIESLTFEEIVGIWTQKITNWNELGGPNLPIHIIGRTKGYDPIKLFDDFMQLDSKVVDDGLIYSEKGTENWSKTVAQITETDDTALEKLVNTLGSITYFPLQILNNYKTKGYPIKDLAFNGVKATYHTINSEDYFIHRTLNIITNGIPKGNTKTFMNFILSDKGQQLVEDAGFLKLK